MENKKVLLIVNPTAGKGKVIKVLKKVNSHLTEKGCDTDILYTRKKDDAMLYANQYGKDYSMVVSCGGDGTLNEVINGLMNLEKKPKLSFIPFGTTNDFAKTLKVPNTKFITPNKIKTYDEIFCDIGSFDQTYFNYIAAFGIFTEVSYATPQSLKNRMGRIAYFLEGIKELTSIKTYPLTIEVEGKTYTDEFIYGGISNSVSVAGFKGIGFNPKEVELDDGKFEMLFVKAPKNPIELHKVLSALITQKVSSEYIYYFKTDKITVHSEEKMPWTVDGEYAGKKKDVTIKNNKKAIQFVIPKV
ncbi:MAG: diacylglycerol/lipid kinase family protein [Clostridia bacterium]